MRNAHKYRKVMCNTNFLHLEINDNLTLLPFKKYFKLCISSWTGTYEPTEAECDWPSEDEDEELADEIKDKVCITK